MAVQHFVLIAEGPVHHTHTHTQTMSIAQPPLPYALDALAPHISREGMSIQSTFLVFPLFRLFPPLVPSFAPLAVHPITTTIQSFHLYSTITPLISSHMEHMENQNKKLPLSRLRFPVH